jgi:hypothetical protein
MLELWQLNYISSYNIYMMMYPSGNYYVTTHILASTTNLINVLISRCCSYGL